MQQCGSAMCIHMSLPSCSSLPSHPSKSSQSTKLSSLCYIAASCQLSILHMAAQQYTYAFFIYLKSLSLICGNSPLLTHEPSLGLLGPRLLSDPLHTWPPPGFVPHWRLWVTHCSVSHGISVARRHKALSPVTGVIIRQPNFDLNWVKYFLGSLTS